MRSMPLPRGLATLEWHSACLARLGKCAGRIAPASSGKPADLHFSAISASPDDQDSWSSRHRYARLSELHRISPHLWAPVEAAYGARSALPTSRCRQFNANHRVRYSGNCYSMSVDSERKTMPQHHLPRHKVDLISGTLKNPMWQTTIQTRKIRINFYGLHSSSQTIRTISIVLKKRFPPTKSSHRFELLNNFHKLS